ncbi:MAG: hypothetical protein ACRCYQ_01505 [Nocardioides sp.]
MNTSVDVMPEIAVFVAGVRARLSDLDPEVRDELTEGLEADLSELVAEHGGQQPPGEVQYGEVQYGEVQAHQGEVSIEMIVGTPEAYADELRAAAGLPPAVEPAERSRALPDVAGMLDRSRARWERVVARPGVVNGIWSFLVVLRPVWWVCRAWVAVQVADLMFGNWPRTFIPSIGGQLIGILVLLAAVVISVRIGQGRIWPGHTSGPSPTFQRLVLLGLNSLAVLLGPTAVAEVQNYNDYSSLAVDRYGPALNRDGLTYNGQRICDLQPYDADGDPLQGVQLFTREGRPIDAQCDGLPRQRPWMLGDVERWNVFPFGSKTRSDPEPVFQTPNVLKVPAVTSPVPSEESEKPVVESPGPEGTGVGAD